MAGNIERSAQAFKAFRQIVSELKKVDRNFSKESEQFKYVLAQVKEHQVTQRIFGKASNEMEHVSHLYVTYLSSTRRLAELQDRYKGTEKTVAESANLVGLALPKRHN